jgi:hypothetical protein
MNETMIFQALQQLTFNAIMRGVPNDEAIKTSEETVKQMVEKARKIALENKFNTDQ